MKEIQTAIERIKAIKAEDEETMKALADAENILNEADAKHGTLLKDYRQILVSHPNNTQPREEDDNPQPPAPTKEVTFEEALAQTLAKRKEK